MTVTQAQSDSHLARLLGVDKAMVCRLKKRGMPTATLEAAQDWRCRNLNSAQRKDTNSARDWHRHREGTPAAARAALERVQALAQLAHEAAVAGRFSLIQLELQDALRAVPNSHRGQIALSEQTFDALLGGVMRATEQDRQPGAYEAQSAESQAATGRILYAMAAGEEIELEGAHDGA